MLHLLGVINVITADGKKRQQDGEYGTRFESRTTYGGPQRNLSSFADSSKIQDATAWYTTKDYRLRLSTRIESSVLDRSIGNDFEYTKNKYYADSRIWGSSVLAAYPNLGGSFRSPDNKRAVDFRFYAGEFEVSAQYYELSTGLGTHTTPATSSKRRRPGPHRSSAFTGVTRPPCRPTPPRRR